jgi:hypothetical protein
MISPAPIEIVRRKLGSKPQRTDTMMRSAIDMPLTVAATRLIAGNQ